MQRVLVVALIPAALQDCYRGELVNSQPLTRRD